MQCCETTHSFIHHLDFSFVVQEKSTIIAGSVNEAVLETISSVPMILADSSQMSNVPTCECAARVAPAKLSDDTTCCDCKTQSEADLEALVSSTIESFFVDLEDESSFGVYEMHNLFIASDVEVAKISHIGLHKKRLTIH